MEQKIETLRHWQRTIMRLARLAPPSEREAFEYLIIELAVSIDAIDRASIDQAQDRPLS
ncbi:hypothetical protein OSH11_23695 [Kaistia dalseonensis]|uniref:Uncharacterized protein n=1 Tax=Kaistia dalseonensis TaxID=410840 RepID=A0ABU0HEI6_9HYPH|nr:hypothetical protein [Kaistia dalseonensis]MCX5497723.1 hypothetical protein [Kaistia dalseonensis]MDQ0440367.1 hypothetical protein [Kaistia dalseonensis]